MNEFERKAWETREQSTAHPPKRALEAAIYDIERGEIKPIQSVVVIVQRHEDGDISVSTYQAGEYDTLGIVGALARAGRILDQGLD